jgi:hypothetical protein
VIDRFNGMMSNNNSPTSLSAAFLAPQFLQTLLIDLRDFQYNTSNNMRSYFPKLDRSQCIKSGLETPGVTSMRKAGHTLSYNQTAVCTDSRHFMQEEISTLSSTESCPRW